MSEVVCLRGDRLWLWCPGCDDLHDVTVSGDGPVQWTWDGRMDLPTISPSILVRYPTREPHPRNVCHSFVRAGQWMFLADCTHRLVGQTVPMVDVEPHWPWTES